LQGLDFFLRFSQLSHNFISESDFLDLELPMCKRAEVKQIEHVYLEHLSRAD
jgi:hypothetical protein